MIIEIGQTASKNKFPFNLFSLAIMLINKCNYSHYYIKYKSCTGNWKYLDSTAKTVRDRLDKQFEKEYYLDTGYSFGKIVAYKKWQFELNCSYKQFMRFVELHEGKKYSFGQIFGLLINIIFPKIKNPWRNGTEAFICNELILTLLQKFKNLEFENSVEDFDLVETEDVLDAISEL